MLAHGGVRTLFLEAENPRPGLLEQVRGATAWAHVAEVRYIRALPMDQRHNAKIDYPALRRMLAV